MWRCSCYRTNESREHEKRQRKFPPHDTPPMNRCNLTAEENSGPDEAAWRTNRRRDPFARQDASFPQRLTTKSGNRVSGKIAMY